MFARLLIERNVPVPMRDGAILRADVYRPDTDTPVPAIVSRTPYGKSALLPPWGIHATRSAEAGFAVVFQDTRGRFESEGEFYPFRHEGPDGYDTVEWVAGRPWCSGAIGMSGPSYVAATQWLAAMEQPPHLRAIFPAITASEYYEGWTYQGGAFQLGFILFWALLRTPETLSRWARAGKADLNSVMRAILASDEMHRHYDHLPLVEEPTLRQSSAAPFYFDFLAHPARDDYWQTTAINRHYGRIHVPAYHVGGWYDIFLHGTIENYVGMRREGGSEAARQGQRLLLGPWSHGDSTGVYPDYDFGVLSSIDALDLTDVQLRFFGRHLTGEADGADGDPPVRIFVMGENRWREEQEWPLRRTRYTPWFLHGDGNAGGAGGSLSPASPTSEPEDVYVYDPLNPAPTVGGPTLLPGLNVGANSGPKDQRPTEARPDTLVYTSAPLERPVEVTGPLMMVLYAASSARDTDFVARLCDVYPDGASRILAEGILRARFLEGYDHPRLIEPGRVYEYKINLVATSNLFQVGHRVRVDVTSSSFPRFDRNPNTGNSLGQDGAGDLRPAAQRVFHDSEHPSRIVLPIIPRETRVCER